MSMIRRLRNFVTAIPDRLRRGLAVGLAAGLIGLGLHLTPLGPALEENIGLDWLFRIRGEVEPPADVAVISLDRRSAQRLGLLSPQDPPSVHRLLPQHWPRLQRAQLIDRLVELGASMIALDTLLDTPTTPEEDDALAAAIARAGRVVLVEAMSRDQKLLTGPGGTSLHLETTRITPALPIFAQAARGVAPFHLPKAPARVSQFWAFLSDASHRPTLPALALQVYAVDAVGAHDPWRRMLDALKAGDLPPDRATLVRPGAMEELAVSTRRAFRRDPALTERIAERLEHRGPDAPTAGQRHLVAALADLYGGPDSRYLNFYGPPGTIPIIAVADVIDGTTGALPDLTGKAVFVGVAETYVTGERDDSFPTVFSRSDGLDLSGVEIAATAFANLLDGVLLRPLDKPLTLGVLLALGVAAGLIACHFSVRTALLLLIGMGGACFLGTQYAFRTEALWLPLATPLLVQLPLAAFIGVTWRFFATDRDHRNMTRAMRHYLPAKVVEDLTKRRGEFRPEHELLFGTCLVTNAAGFAGLVERTAPQDLTVLLNRYFDTLLAPIDRYGGTVCNIASDGVVCIWTAPRPGARTRMNAVRAALDVLDRVDGFNRAQAPLQLPTCLGLHAGWLTVGNIGGGGHFTYGPVGEIPSIALGIESLNSRLGTRVLASEAVAAEISDFLVRRLGCFLIPGKPDPVVIYEIVGEHAAVGPAAGRLCSRFEEALWASERLRWSEATRLFEALLAEFPSDGPTNFYLNHCRARGDGTTAPENPAVILLKNK